MSNRLELYGSIDQDGVFKLHNRRRFEEWCFSNKGKELVVKFERKARKRSLQQNNYYHGVVVQEVRLGLLNIGYDLTPDGAHEFLKQHFNKQFIVNKDGVGMELAGSTTEMTTTQMMEYVEKIAQWAAEYLGVTIPLPNQSLTMDL